MRREIKSGDTFGRWTVIKEAAPRGYARYWLCRCECGTERDVYGNGLLAEASLSCGCLKRDRTRETNAKRSEVRKGSQWGRWTVLSDDPCRRYYRMCRCECGTEKPVVLSALLSGRSQSCGCLQGKRRQTARTQFSQHRMTNTPTWISWTGMIERCENPKQASYRDYGGRGITVCDRWRDFSNFLADMGERPDDTTLDRIDGNKGYDPGNCRWATRTEQNRNRRNNRFLEYGGLRLSLAEWSERTGISSSAISVRIDRYQWTVPEALGFEVRPPRGEISANRKNGTLLTHGGKTLPLGIWARERGIRQPTLSLRLARGWTVAQALGFERAPRRQRTLKPIAIS